MDAFVDERVLYAHSVKPPSLFNDRIVPVYDDRIIHRVAPATMDGKRVPEDLRMSVEQLAGWVA
jgi:hypothetical protein